ncbi:hypothetical protein Ahy_A10g047323 [Arachis hypogaea]|uniref:Uncharacterized protein n=1 Tax=Arachis hypogaea TaxID=3818 RepID=A0A445B291_ARAHY|nr:hypothetical protein Ahy_A10g047323 [Arachis hypogaea]
MGTFNLSVYHGGRFGYDNGTLEYIGGERTVIEDIDMDCWSLFEAYAEVGQFGYTKKKISGFWYKDPNSEWLEKDLKLFEGDRDAIETCKIAGNSGHVELYVVHKIDDAEDFPEVGFLDVGGQSEHNQEVERGNDEEVHNEKQLVIFQGELGQEGEMDNVEKVDEGDKYVEEQGKSNSDEDSDDEDFISSADEVDSADDVVFIDSEEEYDDESGFDEVGGGTDGNRVDKGKRGIKSDEEGFNSDEVDLEYEVGGGSKKEDSEDDDNHEASRYPIHRDVKDMTTYKWKVGTVYASREEFKDTVTAYAVQTRRGLRYAKLDLVRVRAVCQKGCPFWLYTAKMSEEETWQLRSMNLKHTCGQSHMVGILHTGWLSRVFRKKVQGNPKVKIKDLVNKAQRKWNLTVTTLMAARSRQAALEEIQGAYQKQYKRIVDYCSELLRANPRSSVTLKVQRSPDFEVEDQHQRLNNYCIFQRVCVCLAACKKSFLQCRKKKTRGGRKASSSRPITSSKASSQPVMQSESGGLRRSTRSRSSSQPQPTTTTSKPNSTQSGSRPISSSTRPKTKPTRSKTQQPPAPKKMGAASSSQAARTVSFSHKFPLHVSPRKLRLMAKLPPRLWGKL